MGRDLDKQRAYQREWFARRRREYFQDKSCVRCGSTTNLELDHIDPTTKVHSRIWSWSEARRLVELAKCQVLCDPCHRRKTAEDGTQSGERNGRSKLTTEQVETIRASSLPTRELAALHAVHIRTIQKVRHGDRW